MNSPPSPRTTSITNELAKERNRKAAERTLLGWIDSCLALIGFGIAFDRIFSAIARLFPETDPVVSQRWTHLIGLSAIALGIFLLFLAIISYLGQTKSLAQEDYLTQRSHFLMLILNGSIILFGCFALVAVFLGVI